MPLRNRYAVVAALALVTITGTGCTTTRETKPAQTAREQLMLSKAADLASAKINPNLPAGNAIFVDTSYFNAGSGYRGKYAIARIRSQLLSEGYRLVGTTHQADTVAEISTGALSVDQSHTQFGLPSFTIPVPLSGPFNTPRIALYQRARRIGIAKFNVSFYSAKTGQLEDIAGPVYGFSYDNHSSFLGIGIGWAHNNLLPPQAKAAQKGI